MEFHSPNYQVETKGKRKKANNRNVEDDSINQLKIRVVEGKSGGGRTWLIYIVESFIKKKRESSLQDKSFKFSFPGD